jgi:3-hydroxybutyryl-CoA dehydrogenase
MKILVVGNSNHFDECRQKLGDHDYTRYESHDQARIAIDERAVVFDFLTSINPDGFRLYADSTVTVFANVWRHSLAELSRRGGARLKCSAFGFNGFPTMFNRDILEVSLYDHQ